MRLPVADPMEPVLGFPDGMAVFVGPSPGHFGWIDWSANPISPPSKYHGGTDMRYDFGPCVPVRPRGIIGRVTWHNVRWVIPHNAHAQAPADANPQQTNQP